ncbi:MAG: hypothetical protein EA353_09795 [Puniceicoccaceae bacterium]|nr:MAG: hypothetical protein EA353_09795 [Puniceicoccaceae bacterium]
MFRTAGLSELWLFSMDVIFFMLGFRDEYRGLAWAILKAGYSSQVYACIQEIKIEEKPDG